MNENEHHEEDPLSNSMMDALRAKHQALGASKSIDIPLPGYDGLLVVTYRVLDVKKEIGDINRRIRREFKQEMERILYSTIDVMARSCVAISTTRNGELWPLSASIGPDEPPVCYDSRLAEFMGFVGAESARQVILAVFQNIETMVLAHGQELSAWMTDTTKEVTTEFQGE